MHFEDNFKKNDLIEHLCMLLSTLGATEKVIDREVVINENHLLNAESLKCDIQDAFQMMYKMDPNLAYQLSRGHDLLQEEFEQLDKVILCGGKKFV